MSELLERIRRHTGWNDVREERRTIRWLGQRYHDRKIDLLPAAPGLPEIYFVLSDDYDMLQQFGMSEWHGHPEIDEAIALAADLVAGRKCVLEEWSRAKKYAGSAIAGPSDVLLTLRHDAAAFRRVFFNRQPIEEPIDFARYHKGKAMWTERAHLARLKESYAKLGMKVDLD